MFYWTLLNVENHQKYTLTALQLYAVTNEKALKGEKSATIFKNLIETINILNSEGLILNINGKFTRFYGILTMCLGDTPALNWLGGFKVSVSKTLKFCRSCEIKRGSNMKIQNDCEIIPRTLSRHKKRLEQLRRVDLETHRKKSIKYGINFPSPLLQINDFNICKSLLQDPMHILYEGICHLELNCFFNEITVEKKI